MHLNIARRCRPLMFALPIVLIVVAFGFSAGIPALARTGDASLEFVGNLIGAFHDISLDRLDPTYPHCF